MNFVAGRVVAPVVTAARMENRVETLLFQHEKFSPFDAALAQLVERLIRNE